MRNGQGASRTASSTYPTSFGSLEPKPNPRKIMTNNNQSQAENIHDEIDIEEYAKRGEHPPPARRYRIRIDREKFVVPTPSPTGRALLTLAGKVPPDRFSLTQKFHGGAVRPVGLDDTVDLTQSGVERFMTLPLDQTEG
jgi:hypothetical protein